MRAVLDSNVLVSATLIRGGREDQILRAWQHGAFQLVLSPRILDEIGRALFYEKRRKTRWMTEEEVAALVRSLAREAILVSGRTRVKACRDPDGDTFLEAAIESRARYLVTGDTDLLGRKTYCGIGIVTPAMFLAVLRTIGPPDRGRDSA